MSAQQPANGNGIERRVTALEEGVGEIRETMAEIRTTIATALAQQGRPTFAGIREILLAIVVIGGVVWAAIRMQNQADISPVISEQAVSKTERLDNRRDINRVSDNQTILSAKVDQGDLKLIEVEGQFDKERKIRNISEANNQRIIAMLWEKSFGSRYPSEVQYYPETISPNYSK